MMHRLLTGSYMTHDKVNCTFQILRETRTSAQDQEPEDFPANYKGLEITSVKKQLLGLTGSTV